MPDFRTLMTQPSEKELKTYQREYKKSLKEAKKNDKIHPIPEREHAFLRNHLYNMASNAVSQRDEALLDHIYAEHEAIVPGDESFREHIQYYRACLRISEHRFEEAIVMLKELEDHRSLSLRSHILHLLVDIYNHLKDYKAAAFYVHLYFENWDKNHAEDTRFYNYSGFNYMLQILVQADEFEHVVKYGEKRMEFKYSDEKILYFMVAQSCLNLKDFEKGLEYYKYIFKKKNPYPEAFVNVGEYYGHELGDWDNAIKYYIKAVKACGKDPFYQPFLYKLYPNFKPFFNKLNEPARANWHRRKLFKAMGTPLLSELVVLFSRDTDSIDVYRNWLEEKLKKANA